MPNHQDPRLYFAAQPTPPARPDEPTPPEDATFRLGDPAPAPGGAEPAGSEDATFRFDGPVFAPGGVEPAGAEDATFRFDGPVPVPVPPEGDEPTRATMLDPDSWSSEGSYAAPPSAAMPVPVPVPVDVSEPDLDRTVPHLPDGGTAFPAAAVAAVAAGVPDTGGLRRFGPGVPGPDTSAGTAQTAAIWHGTLRPGDPVPPAGPEKRRRRALRGWLLPVLVLLAVLAYLAWQRLPGSVKVDGASVRNATAVQGCHSTAKVVGTLRTSGGAGTVRYRWRRSDGTVSDELKQHVAKGRHRTDVVLLWTFDGPGSLTATATLDVLAPQHVSASTTFTYRCAG